MNSDPTWPRRWMDTLTPRGRSVGTLAGLTPRSVVREPATMSQLRPPHTLLPADLGVLAVGRTTAPAWETARPTSTTWPATGAKEHAMGGTPCEPLRVVLLRAARPHPGRHRRRRSCTGRLPARARERRRPMASLPALRQLDPPATPTEPTRPTVRHATRSTCHCGDPCCGTVSSYG